MTATLKNAPIKATATSKMREEKAKAGNVVTVKQPLKALPGHHGIPIILNNKKQTEVEAKPKLKPVSANSVHIKVRICLIFLNQIIVPTESFLK